MSDKDCPECKGTGWVTLFTSREKCKACAGKLTPGRYTVTASDVVMIEVPPGWSNKLVRITPANTIQP